MAQRWRMPEKSLSLTAETYLPVLRQTGIPNHEKQFPFRATRASACAGRDVRPNPTQNSGRKHQLRRCRISVPDLFVTHHALWAGSADLVHGRAAARPGE